MAGLTLMISPIITAFLLEPITVLALIWGGLVLVSFGFVLSLSRH
jgi:hypothetical protein